MEISINDLFANGNFIDLDTLPSDHPILFYLAHEGYIEEGEIVIEINDLLDNLLNKMPEPYLRSGWSFEYCKEDGFTYQDSRFPQLYFQQPEH